jgi:hypothetical protein
MDEFALLRGVADSFREYGFDAELGRSPVAVDGELILTKGGVRRSFALEVKLPLNINTLRQRGPLSDVIFVTDHVSARTADVLRRLDVQFVDAAGNAFLDSDEWHVDVRGRRRNDLAGARYATLATPTNLYSAKRAQVVFALLTWADLLDAGIRAVADAAGVSVGLAQSTTKELRQRGLWPDHESSRSTLIDGWAAAFPGALGRSLTIRGVRAEQLERFVGPVSVSGATAPSAHIRATTGVVYVDELSTGLLAMNRWRIDGPSNLVVRRRFWSRTEHVDGEAPPLLVYADLLASDDSRVRAVANDYRRRV